MKKEFTNNALHRVLSRRPVIDYDEDYFDDDGMDQQEIDGEELRYTGQEPAFGSLLNGKIDF